MTLVETYVIDLLEVADKSTYVIIKSNKLILAENWKLLFALKYT